jgi:hypothetical protein
MTRITKTTNDVTRDVKNADMVTILPVRFLLYTLNVKRDRLPYQATRSLEQHKILLKNRLTKQSSSPPRNTFLVFRFLEQLKTVRKRTRRYVHQNGYSDKAEEIKAQNRGRMLSSRAQKSVAIKGTWQTLTGERDRSRRWRKTMSRGLAKRAEEAKKYTTP